LPELKEEKDDKEKVILGYKLSPSTQMSSIVPPFSIVATNNANHMIWT
jgi:hypothetical protein